ncbi:MAG: phosphate starvation-inducible protein PsiF [Hyphomicrobiales bacterium]|nr:phosphate starvation-inducible protein PsiF [Hyphomicrobiales bacterium]
MKKVIIAAALAAFVAGPALAQTAAPAAPAAKPAAPTAAAPTTTAPAATPMKGKERTAKSMECSKQADSQGLHGKPRKKFMSTCKKS